MSDPPVDGEELTEERLVKLYSGGLSIRTIGAMHGWSYQRTRVKLLATGVPIRGHGGSRKGNVEYDDEHEE